MQVISVTGENLVLWKSWGHAENREMCVNGHTTWGECDEIALHSKKYSVLQSPIMMRCMGHSDIPGEQGWPWAVPGLTMCVAEAERYTMFTIPSQHSTAVVVEHLLWEVMSFGELATMET